MTQTKKYFLIKLPTIIVNLLLVLVVINRYFIEREVAGDNHLYYFVISLISTLFLSLYLHVVLNHKIQYKAEVFGLLYYFLFLYTVLIFIRGNLHPETLAYFVFVLSLISRLTKRLILGGFPLMSFIFNYIGIYLSLNNIYFLWIPIIYTVLQIIEDLLNIRYEFTIKLLNSRYSEILLHISLYGFFIIKIFIK